MNCTSLPRVLPFISWIRLPVLLLAASALALAEPVDFDLPAQSGDAALLAFSKQSQIEVLFSYDELRNVRSTEVVGRLEPDQALVHLLTGTGFTARRSSNGKFVVSKLQRRYGAVRGRLLTPAGRPAAGVRVFIPELRKSTLTDEHGEFDLSSLRPGRYPLVATADGYVPLLLGNIQIQPEAVETLPARSLQEPDHPAKLEAVLVKGKSADKYPFDRDMKLLPIRTAVGNLDLRRTEDDALPYTVYDRSQLNRSGVVNLNEFLQRELLDSDAATHPPEQNGSADTFMSTSANLSLRGYGTEETVVLINGRRLPEVLTSGSSPLLPDVNFIPLSLVQQIEVLPVSASALYTGNAVGGVINIVLRPDVDAAATEVTATYTNSLAGFDAPQSAVSLLHAQSLLGGALRLRFNASTTRSTPATEAELGFHRQMNAVNDTPDQPLYRATPNVSSTTGKPLFGDGSPTVTSVAPGADGLGGIGAFSGREGVRNTSLFATDGALAASIDSLEYPYGRRQRRDTFFGSAVYDLFPWLEVGLDATISRTVANRGFDVIRGDLVLGRDASINPFGQDVLITLNETAPLLGEKYSEARLEYSSLVFGAMLKLPQDWRASVDVQYANNVTKYRGLGGADRKRWQSLVDQGLYNPLRDTQVFAPPSAFYDEALIYRGGRGQFVTLGDYTTVDIAGRLTNESLVLPTGVGAVNVGGDYRLNHMANFRDERRFSDGTLATEPIRWSGRTLQRYSAFAELQAPLLPPTWLPRWIHGVETDLAVRYVGADTSQETNIAPTFGLKIDFPAGFSFRGSVTTSNRFPTPYMSHRVFSAAPTDTGVDYILIIDPRRGNERTYVLANDLPNPNLRPEAAVSQTAGLLYQSGRIHRFRVSLDFIDTRKTNELFLLTPQSVLDLENLWPERVNRLSPYPNDRYPVGIVQSVYTGITNLAWRHSQNWNAAVNYGWTKCFGGTLEAYARVVSVVRFDVQGLPTSSVVDELNDPDGAAPNLLKYRSNFGVSWSNRAYGFGLDGHYFHSRTIPESQWSAQGSNHIDPFWQFDAHVHADLKRWLPWKSNRYGLRAQLRVNNIFGTQFPRYVADDANSGVQAYGDWRGPVYSLSLTATF